LIVRLLALLAGLGALAALAGGPAQAAPPAAPAVASAACGPLPAPTGTIVNVDTVAELQNAVANAASNTTILIADGDYALTNTLHLTGGVSNVALRGASGNRDAVIIRGQGMNNAAYGNVPHGVLVGNAQDVLIADLTLRDAYYHLVQIQGEQGAQRPTLYNLHLIDGGEQLVKVSTDTNGPYADGGLVACSLLEYTDRARSWYTNGVDALAVADWVIRDNVFRRIRAPVGQLAGPAVLMWRNSLNTVVERNQFIECDRGIALGLSSPDANSRDDEDTYDHQGGMIRNNFVYRAAGAQTGDVGITVNYSANYAILHNTVIQNDTFDWAIEYRFASSSGTLAYNLADGPIVQRDGAGGVLTGNVTNAAESWFVAAASGDLHLLATATGAINQAATLADAQVDYDGLARPIGAAPDVGADEWGALNLPERVYLPLIIDS
jgi:hypothetical protein